MNGSRSRLGWRLLESAQCQSISINNSVSTEVEISATWRGLGRMLYRLCKQKWDDLNVNKCTGQESTSITLMTFTWRFSIACVCLFEFAEVLLVAGQSCTPTAPVAVPTLPLCESQVQSSSNSEAAVRGSTVNKISTANLPRDTSIFATSEFWQLSEHHWPKVSAYSSLHHTTVRCVRPGVSWTNDYPQQ